jgi:hypothetical protein
VGRLEFHLPDRALAEFLFKFYLTITNISSRQARPESPNSSRMTLATQRYSLRAPADPGDSPACSRMATDCPDLRGSGDSPRQSRASSHALKTPGVWGRSPHVQCDDQKLPGNLENLSDAAHVAVVAIATQTACPSSDKPKHDYRRPGRKTLVMPLVVVTIEVVRELQGAGLRPAFSPGGFPSGCLLVRRALPFHEDSASTGNSPSCN